MWYKLSVDKGLRIVQQALNYRKSRHSLQQVVYQSFVVASFNVKILGGKADFDT